MILIMAIILRLVEEITMRLLGIGMDRAKFSLPSLIFEPISEIPRGDDFEFESRLRSPVLDGLMKPMVRLGKNALSWGCVRDDEWESRRHFHLSSSSALGPC